jgi:type IV pilus assembly protein PilC/MSHA biogenesis protein MshG
MFFYRQFGTLMKAGVPIVQALTTLASQAGHPKLKRIILEMRDRANRGVPISQTLARYPEVFSPIELGLVRSGEEGGFFDESLTQVANYLERDIALRNLYRRITFPQKIQVAASFVVILATNAIIDSIRKDSQHLSSPLTNVGTWYWLGPLLLAVFLFLRVGLANPSIRYLWDLVTIHLPGMGKMLREIASAKFGRAFGALYRAGLPLGKALRLSADATGNEFMRSRIYPMATRLESGGGLAATFRESRAFSPIVLDMIQTGETTGNVEEMLTKMAEFYEDEAQTKSTQVANFTGVLIGLGVGVYIGFIVISFWTQYAQGLQREVGD